MHPRRLIGTIAASLLSLLASAEGLSEKPRYIDASANFPDFANSEKSSDKWQYVKEGMESCEEFDVLVVGGGASGTAAALQAARMGCSTFVAEEGPWIGGMLTSAGVSAIDGNYKLRGGIFREFTDALAEHYGGYDALRTAWVSNIMYEPSVGEALLEKMVAAEPQIRLEKGLRFEGATKLEGRGWEVCLCNSEGRKKHVRCRILIDGTELGDIAKAVGVKYHIGFDDKARTGEEMAFEEGFDIVQDLTMVMTLKDFGPDADMSIPMPEGYCVSNYANCCENPLNSPDFEKPQPKWSREMMLSYGRLQNGKYMINWPIEANDFYANIIELSREQRDSVIDLAKKHTLGFLYFLQSELGYRNLGLADDEFPSEDRLALIPYHRESRRIEGEHLFILDEISDRYRDNAFRTGIAVGDYPVDHHHYANPQWRKLNHLWFAPVPSYSLPAGCLVPLEVEDFIVAEKSVSVSNLVNGTTRLQPVVLEIGQAAGAFAALALQKDCKVREVGVRELQGKLLEAGAYIQPYLDLPLDDPNFAAVQRIGSTGILRAEGRNVDWSNETWMHTEQPLRWCDLYLEDYYGIGYNPSTEEVSVAEFKALIKNIKQGRRKSFKCKSRNKDEARSITRLEACLLLDSELNPFAREVDFQGNLL